MFRLQTLVLLTVTQTMDKVATQIMEADAINRTIFTFAQQVIK
jgi:hypothetical protein